jgi:hypothetical protein
MPRTRPAILMPLFALTLTSAAPVFAAPSFQAGQPPVPPASSDRPSSSDRAWIDLFNAGNYAQAARLLEALAKESPQDPIISYNLACAHAMAGASALAESALQRSLELGFTDFYRLLNDPNLASLKDSDTLKAITLGWNDLQDAAISARLENYRKTLALGPFSSSYTTAKSADLRLAFFAAVDPKILADIQVELATLQRSWQTQVLADAPTSAPSQELSQTQSKAKPDAQAQANSKPDPWVLVYLPTPPHFDSWARKTVGVRAEFTGGIYNNHQQQLVAKGPGPTLRHEFFHVLHWRHMARLGQIHPTWISEGLCSLAEDWRDDKPLHSTRSNNARRVIELRAWIGLEKFMQAKPTDFHTSRSLANYAMARMFFMYLHEKNKLAAWYAQYCLDFSADPTGIRTTEKIFAKPISAIDKDFVAWVKESPKVPDINDVGLPRIPADIDVHGVGVTIASAQLGLGLIPGDVITHINDQPTADLSELARELAKYKPRQQVTLTIVRNRQKVTVNVRLLDWE